RNIPAFEQLEELLTASLHRQLLGLISRTLILELHVQRIQGLLVGATPEDRFQYYVDQLGEPHFQLALMREYPVLGRAMWVCAKRWLRFSLEFSGHLYSDLSIVSERLKHDLSRDELTAVCMGMGDTHRGGRSVTVLTFSSGFRVVYKPRSLRAEAHF